MRIILDPPSQATLNTRKTYRYTTNEIKKGYLNRINSNEIRTHGDSPVAPSKVTAERRALPEKARRRYFRLAVKFKRGARANLYRTLPYAAVLRRISPKFGRFYRRLNFHSLKYALNFRRSATQKARGSLKEKDERFYFPGYGATLRRARICATRRFYAAKNPHSAAFNNDNARNGHDAYIARFCGHF